MAIMNQESKFISEKRIERNGTKKQAEYAETCTFGIKAWKNVCKLPDIERHNLSQF